MHGITLILLYLLVQYLLTFQRPALRRIWCSLSNHWQPTKSEDQLQHFVLAWKHYGIRSIFQDATKTIMCDYKICKCSVLYRPLCQAFCREEWLKQMNPLHARLPINSVAALGILSVTFAETVWGSSVLVSAVRAAEVSTCVGAFVIFFLHLTLIFTELLYLKQRIQLNLDFAWRILRSPISYWKSKC